MTTRVIITSWANRKQTHHEAVENNRRATSSFLCLQMKLAELVMYANCIIIPISTLNGVWHESCQLVDVGCVRGNGGQLRHERSTADRRVSSTPASVLRLCGLWRRSVWWGVWRLRGDGHGGRSVCLLYGVCSDRGQSVWSGHGSLCQSSVLHSSSPRWLQERHPSTAAGPRCLWTFTATSVFVNLFPFFTERVYTEQVYHGHVDFIHAGFKRCLNFGGLRF